MSVRRHLFARAGALGSGRDGLVLTVSGLIGISLHAPIGVTSHKRTHLIGGAGELAAVAVWTVEAPTMPVVLAADTIMAVLVLCPPDRSSYHHSERQKPKVRIGLSATFWPAG